MLVTVDCVGSSLAFGQVPATCLIPTHDGGDTSEHASGSEKLKKAFFGIDPAIRFPIFSRNIDDLSDEIVNFLAN
jgi:hypothetical protein